MASRTVLMVVVLVLAAACTEEAPPEPQEAAAFVVGTTEDVSTVDPAACFDDFCAYGLLPNVHEGLVRFGGEDLEPEPALASSWEVSEDGLVWTFTIEEGRELHDGTAVTAALVRSSLLRIREVGREDGPAFLYYELSELSGGATSGITSIEAPDARTVRITLAAPDPSFLARLAFPAAAVISGDEPAPAGAGPYRIASVDEDRVTLDAVSAAAGIERVEVRWFPSADALVDALRDGTVDVALRTWAPDELEALRGIEDVTLVEHPGPRTRFLAFDVTRPPFDRVEVRRAIAATVDREDLVEETFAGNAVPLYSLVPQGFEVHRPVLEGVSDALDEEIAFDLWHTPTHYGPQEPEVAELLAEGLRDEGFDVTLRSAEWPEYKASLARGDYGAFLLGWFPDVLHPSNYLAPFLSSRTSTTIGSNYASDVVDELLTELRATQDPSREEEILVALQERLAEDVPYVPLVQPSRELALGPGVRGARPTLAHALPLWSMEAG